MEIGLGVLELPASAFWDMAMPEFAAAFDGWQEKNTPNRESQEPVTSDDLAELEAYCEEVDRRLGNSR